MLFLYFYFFFIYIYKRLLQDVFLNEIYFGWFVIIFHSFILQVKLTKLKVMIMELFFISFFKSGFEEVMFIHTHYNCLIKFVSEAEEPALSDKVQRLDSVF